MRDCELTVLMPCLNEAETLVACISKARRFLDESGVRGEILIADNGSVDASREIAGRLGARVVQVELKGYGAALQGGIAAAQGRFVVMGDADDSYDFLQLSPFVEKLRVGADLVIGNRFQGGIAPGAMPFLHRYLGNPVLSFLGRLFFSIPVGDFHCGLRGFVRERLLALDLRTTGMDYASEMIVRAALAGYAIAEVPTTLKPDGRGRKPHLRTWSDGWKHLRFLLMYSPRWLFLYPGLALLCLGVLGVGFLLPGILYVGHVGFDIHTFIVACIVILLGLQSISFALIARRYGAHRGFIPRSVRYSPFLEWCTLERMLVIALGLLFLGVVGVGSCVGYWASVHFGPLQEGTLLRLLMLSLTAIAAAIQLAFTAFLAGIIDIPGRLP
jgi:glycosyltransferase involved in cell wall biosynthesis